MFYFNCVPAVKCLFFVVPLVVLQCVIVEDFAVLQCVIVGLSVRAHLLLAVNCYMLLCFKKIEFSINNTNMLFYQ